jgi:hypothetical protein
MNEDSEKRCVDTARTAVGHATPRRSSRPALVAVCLTTAAAAVVASRYGLSIAALTVLLPGFCIAYSLFLAATVMNEPGSAGTPRRLGDGRPRTRATAVAGLYDKPMTVRDRQGHWYLANEYGELVETSFDEVVEWLDTLWDIRQLEPARAAVDPEPVVFQTV